MVTWVMWNLLSVHLETVLVSVQERCTVFAKCTIGLEIVLDAPDGTPLGGKAQVEARFSPFEGSANLDARWVHALRRTYDRLGKHFGSTRWYS